jgi:hypothetical protein
MGVNLGSKSLMGGVIFAIPTSTTIYFKAHKILPKTYGYSYLKHSFKFKPNLPRRVY